LLLPNAPQLPRIWNEAELDEEANKALQAFVDRRLAEPETRYAEHLKARRNSVQALFRALSPLDPARPDPDIIQKILLDDELQAALRYVAGPPISDDDLGVVVTRAPKRLTRRDIRSQPDLAVKILKLICHIADASRFPWIREGRRPLDREIRMAIRSTAALHATQSVQTERRGYGREVERLLRDRLLAQGFLRVPMPNGGKINAPVHLPPPGSFYGECALYGRRADLLIGLPDLRRVAIEAKDSSSVVNSVKRVLNDTAAKARFWNGKLGESIIPVALLSGVFGVGNLRTAQSAGLYLVWAHDLDSFVDWLAAQ
jgi:hypothetical protein